MRTRIKTLVLRTLVRLKIFMFIWSKLKSSEVHPHHWDLTWANDF